MTTPNVAYEQNGHAPDDGFYPPMEDLPDFKPEIHREGERQDDNDSRDFNKFIFQENEFRRVNPLAIITLGDITDPHEKLLIDILLSMFLLEWNAEATNRKGLREKAEKDANFWKGKFGDEHFDDADARKLDAVWKRNAGGADAESSGETSEKEASASVEDLLASWHAAAAFMSRVAIDEGLYGLRAVERHRHAFLSARKRRQAAEFTAASLPPARNKYFWAMIRSYQLMLDENEDVALGRPIRDYTDTKAQLAKGVSVHRLVGDMPLPFQTIHSRVFASVSDGNIIRDYNATLFTKAWPHDRRPPKRLNGLARLLRRRGDDDDDDYEDDDEEDRRRRDPAAKHEKRGKDKRR